jgi:F-type H+-transporting ATPase subunit a
MWVIIAVLAVLSFIATRNLKDVPGPAQNVAEMAIEALQNFFGSVMGEMNMRRYFGVFATMFIFIIVSNYSGLLPGAGEGFAVPTANLSVVAGLSIIMFFMTHSVGFRRQGFMGYLKSFLKPIAVMLPFTLIDQVVRPFSLALRLYGNLHAEEMVSEQLRHMFPILLPLVMMALSLIFCLIQAMVFTMLSSIYVTEATGEEEE